ncbi:MAG TPA: ABC transporter substrate-binding protein, partial [Solirubrobacterales bacterium]|nr:ABC transporter substrate-binding protein [Solirubrobacterales bacterium]
INEPMFRANADGENEPWLVTDVETTDNQRVWTFKVRKGVKFSDGQPLTSADFLFTFETARKSAIWAPLLASISKLEAPSPSTFRIICAKPAPELPAVLGQWSFGIVPKNYGGVSEKEFAEHPVGTGPFVLGAWKRGESVTLEKNPGYWDAGKPYLDKVVLKTVSSPESRVAQLKGGQLDLVAGPPWSQVSAIESAPELSIGETPLVYDQFLILNSRNPLFQDQRVREAVELAIDRPGIVDAVLGGHGEPAGAWVPPAVPYSDSSIEPASQDIGKAKELLAEAVQDGVDPKFTILTLAESPYWSTASQIVQQNLEEVGFKVNIQAAELASAIESMSAGKFDLGVLEIYDATTSPAELFGYYNAYEGVYSGVDTAATTKLAEAAQNEVDPQKREELWHRLQAIIDEDQYLLPLTYGPGAWAYRDAVSGFGVSSTGIPWLAETSIAH